nr:MAG TPA: chromosome partition protein [Caudoviricetes sp.]
MKIEIKSMTLQNFKKVRSQEIEFCHNMLISGGNKVGKTTIYDAYLWGVFGVLSKKNGIVQPLDKNNEVVHKLETSVTIILNINDEREVKIQRILTEKWVAKDTADEKLNGTQTERLFNDVPLSDSAFKKKLGELCNYNQWFMQSNINLFMSYKIDDRRKMLMSMAGEIDEEKLMQPYPIVYQGVIVEKKDLNGIYAQHNTSKKKADKELGEIPAKVNAQDALVVKADFESLRKRKEELDKQISAIDAALEGKSEKDPLMEKYLADLQAHNEKVANAQKVWQDKKMNEIDSLTKQISEACTKLQTAKNVGMSNIKAYTDAKSKLPEVQMKFNNKMKLWNDANEKEFGDFKQTDVCPVCGRPYTDEMKEKEYANAVAEFNANKSAKLTEYQNEASELNSQIAVIKGNINTFEQITKAHDEEAVKNAQTTYDELIKKRTDLQNMNWEHSAEKVVFDRDLATIQATKPAEKIDTSVEKNKADKKALSDERDEIIKQLASEETNKRIEKEKDKLNARSLELAKIIADCNEAMKQIKAYKKAKITLVEEKVNSFFSLVRWKFYEQNTSNDDEKAICSAIDKDGVDYDNTNDGTVIDMGVDIISGISKAYDLYVPLFVDRKESAENIVSVEQQTIFLQCVFGQPLKIESI